MVLTLNVCINCGKCMCDDSHASAFNFFNGERNTVSFVILHEMYIYVLQKEPPDHRSSEVLSGVFLAVFVG